MRWLDTALEVRPRRHSKAVSSHRSPRCLRHFHSTSAHHWSAGKPEAFNFYVVHPLKSVSHRGRGELTENTEKTLCLRDLCETVSAASVRNALQTGGPREVSWRIRSSPARAQVSSLFLQFSRLLAFQRASKLKSPVPASPARRCLSEIRVDCIIENVGGTLSVALGCHSHRPILAQTYIRMHKGLKAFRTEATEFSRRTQRKSVFLVSLLTWCLCVLVVKIA